jgi:hypothetical protein
VGQRVLVIFLEQRPGALVEVLEHLVKAQVTQAFDFGGHADFPQREVGANQPLLGLWCELFRVPQQMASWLTAVDEVFGGFFQHDKCRTPADDSIC